MEIRILGPLEAFANGRELPLPSGRARSLLALLALNRGQVVSIDRIVDTLWNGAPPATAAKAVQGYVSSIRRAIESTASSGRVLVTRSPGYVLLLDDAALDASRFESLAGDARRALEDQAPSQALDRLDEALALWRGPALPEFAFDDFAQPVIRRLEELRLEAVEDRTEALLRLGRHEQAVGELEALVAEHPLRERPRAQLMLALYRSGRQAEALDAYRAGRRLLSSELGLEPSRDLQELERAILAHDPALRAPPRQERARAPARQAGTGRRSFRYALAAVAVIALATVAVAAVTSLGSPDSVSVGPPPAQGVMAVDTETSEIVVAHEFGTHPFAIVARGDDLWVADTGEGIVRRIDPGSGEIAQEVGIGAPAIDLAVEPDAVWVATGSAGTLARVDPEVGAVVQRLPLAAENAVVVPDAAAVAVGRDGTLWAASAEGVLHVDPEGGAPTRVDVGPTRADDLVLVGDAVFASLFDGRTVRIETASRAVTGEFESPESGRLTGSADGVWVAAGESLYLLDPRDATLVDGIQVGGHASVAIDGDTAWVVVNERQALLRVDLESREVTEAIGLGAYPIGVAIAGGRVWVTVEDESPFT